MKIIRIEAEIERLEKEVKRDTVAALAHSNPNLAVACRVQAHAHAESAAFLRAIIADLPAESETPPTLEEFRQSEEWFLVKDGMQIYLAMYERRNKAGDCCVLLDAMYTERPEPGAHASIARMPRFYPVEGE